MFSTDDTIVAIATPAGRGGIGVVRISGPDSHDVASTLLDRVQPLEPRRATFTRARGIDEVIATAFPAPHSYTGEDVVEISAHGSPVVLRAIVEAAVAAGARLAQPGEFTLRAFLSGRLDLVQSEAVADLIDAATPLQARTAFDQLEGTLTMRIRDIERALFDLVARLEASLDFPDEGYHFIDPGALVAGIAGVRGDIERLLIHARRGRMIREGAHVVIVGRPNVGKSSVFNVLAGHARAIVTEVPGTTRDLLTERVDIEGVAVTLVDTAGLRLTRDIVEREGVDRARQAVAVADLLLVVLDRSEPLTADDESLLTETGSQRRVVVANKSDLPAAWDESREHIVLSASSGKGMDELRTAIARMLSGAEILRDAAIVSNVRHIDLLEQARVSLARAERSAGGEGASTPEEFVLTDLQQARGALEEITGRRTTDDMLAHIFERFCIGK
jgi:tRNA modification GTPase